MSANRGPLTPKSDDAPELAGNGGVRGDGASPDCAKTATTALARLALLGIEARHLHADAWALIASTGATIGIVRGADALAAAAAGFEAARADVLEMVRRIGGAAW